MNSFIIYNLHNNSTKEVEFYASEETVIQLSQNTKDVSIKPGNHLLILERHHDLFLDWYIDNILIEEFIVLPLISDEENLIIIQCNEHIDFKHKDIKENKGEKIKKTFFPILYEFNQTCKFSLNCFKQSQLSIFFQKDKNIESRGKDFLTLTLYFENNYCKVFLDKYIENKFQRDLRENLSLFNIELNKPTIIGLSKISNSMIITNKLEKNKEYKLPKEIFENNYARIEETYCPCGIGKYIIDLI